MLFAVGVSGGGALFVTGVTAIVLRDHSGIAWHEELPLNQPNWADYLNPNVPPGSPASSVPPIQEQTIGPFQESMPLGTPGLNVVFMAGGVEPNNIGAWGETVVGEYFPEIQVGQVPVIDLTLGRTRRYDGVLFDENGAPVYVEIKASQGQKSSIGISSRIKAEIEFDAQQSPTPLWIFVGKDPSSGLSQRLNESGIGYKTVKP